MFMRTLFALFLASAATLVGATEPATIVTERTHAVLDAIGTQREVFRADPAKLREFVKSQLNDVMDRPYAAQLVLARHARQLTRSANRAPGLIIARCAVFVRPVTCPAGHGAAFKIRQTWR